MKKLTFGLMLIGLFCFTSCEDMEVNPDFEKKEQNSGGDGKPDPDPPGNDIYGGD